MALDEVRSRVNVPVIGVSQGVKTAIRESNSNTIGIMATVATVNSHIHKYVAMDIDHEVFVWEQPCPELAGLIEQGHLHDDAVRKAAKEYLAPMLETGYRCCRIGMYSFPIC